MCMCVCVLQRKRGGVCLFDRKRRVCVNEMQSVPVRECVWLLVAVCVCAVCVCGTKTVYTQVCVYASLCNVCTHVSVFMF